MFVCILSYNLLFIVISYMMSHNATPYNFTVVIYQPLLSAKVLAAFAPAIKPVTAPETVPTVPRNPAPKGTVLQA